MAMFVRHSHHWRQGEKAEKQKSPEMEGEKSGGETTKTDFKKQDIIQESDW